MLKDIANDSHCFFTGNSAYGLRVRFSKKMDLEDVNKIKARLEQTAASWMNSKTRAESTSISSKDIEACRIKTYSSRHCEGRRVFNQDDVNAVVEVEYKICLPEYEKKPDGLNDTSKPPKKPGVTAEQAHISTCEAMRLCETWFPATVEIALAPPVEEEPSAETTATETTEETTTETTS